MKTPIYKAKSFATIKQTAMTAMTLCHVMNNNASCSTAQGTWAPPILSVIFNIDLNLSIETENPLKYIQ
jgi:hypothetical protein